MRGIETGRDNGERRQFLVSQVAGTSTMVDGSRGPYLLIDPSVSVGGVAKVADNNDAHGNQYNDHDGKCEPKDGALVARGKVDRRCGANYTQVGHILKVVSNEIVGELRIQVITRAQWNDDQKNQQSQLRQHT